MAYDDKRCVKAGLMDSGVAKDSGFVRTVKATLVNVHDVSKTS